MSVVLHVVHQLQFVDRFAGSNDDDSRYVVETRERNVGPAGLHRILLCRSLLPLRESRDSDDHALDAV